MSKKPAKPAKHVIRIEWSEGRFDAQVQDENTLAELKAYIYRKTRVKPEHQRFPNLKSINRATIVKDSTKVKYLDLSNKHLVMVRSEEEETPSTSRGSSASLQNIPSLPALYIMDYYTTFTPIYKSTVVPRQGKKLLVLDIDFTILDVSREGLATPSQCVRPHLHGFLKGVYEDYDIIVWSLTPMEHILWKLETMEILKRDEDYKILLCIGLGRTRSMQATKPLQVIWGRYPEYNVTNTIIVDDTEYNFKYNPDNGIQVFPYSCANFNTDHELQDLQQYLKRIARFADVTSRRHLFWRPPISTT